MKSFIEQFLEHAVNQPERAAILDRYGVYSYSELNWRTAALAQKIRTAIGGKGRVALLYPRTKDYLTAEIAILRAGCCVVPLSDNNPESRIRAFIANAECDLFLTVPEFMDLAGDLPVMIADEMTNDSEDVDLTLNLSEPEDESFLFTTSGSTGVAKGVLHQHAMLVVNPIGMNGIVPISGHSRSIHTLGFDFIGSMMDFLPMIYYGGSIYVCDKEEQKNIGSLTRLIRDQAITCMSTVPSMYKIMRRFCDLSKLDYVMLGSEKVNDVVDDQNVYEIYGSSEACPPVICGKVNGRSDPMVLGKPACNAEVYLLDENGDPISEKGMIGEICVSSCGIAKEYIHMPELSSEKFTECPSDASKRVFHSGDYAAYNENGELVFHGRKDRMIKRHGFRVELGAVDQAIQTCDGIKEAASVYEPFQTGFVLCCYYTGEEKTERELKDFAQNTLPEFMIPDLFRHLEEMPRNEGKKVDFQALKKLAAQI